MNLKTITDAAGEYYLRGVMETASGFNLNENLSFQFFFAYGALDRYGSGTWHLHNDRVILTSKPYPGKDFKLINSKTGNSAVTTVQIDVPNKMIFPFIHCLVNGENGYEVYDADANGTITLPFKNTGTIQLVSELCSERISVFETDTSCDHFTFNIEPWITEVFFDGFILDVKENSLEGKHPLIEKEDCVYSKE